MPLTSRSLFAAGVLALAGSVALAGASDEGWVIDKLEFRLEIRPDGVLAANEALDVDFRGHVKHGIFRDVETVVDYDATHTREYPVTLISVTAADGRRHQVKTLTQGAMERFQIGDPNHTISGKETYRIAYTVGQALNAFADHDELYWNATGVWPARVEHASIIVTAPAGAIQRVDCFQGARGSTEHCGMRFTPNEATFTATRPLAAGEQMTIVTGLRKGAVPDPRPRLSLKPTGSLARPSSLFAATPAIAGIALLGLIAVVGGLGTTWWRVGRDRRYIALQHSPQDDGREETVPIFGARPIAVEFEPPDKIRPGQMGLLIDERADTIDVTATIIDLAVRGYLKITEIPKEGWFGHKDWQINRLKMPDAALLDYERIVLTGLFHSEPQRKISDLKNKFYEDLAKAKKALYADAVARKWFPRNPNTVRTLFRVCGILLLMGGFAVTMALGIKWSAGLIGLPVMLGGLLMAMMSGAMPRRTAAGQDITRRSLGFGRYLKTAEVHQQDFAERANIFTAYLPYAIAFKCVDGWARAFKDIDLQAATSNWYAGAQGFTIGSFSSSLTGFSSAVSTTMTSTPGGSGSSGFSGGSSGGGGGGGGGGSW